MSKEHMTYKTTLKLRFLQKITQVNNAPHYYIFVRGIHPHKASMMTKSHSGELYIWLQYFTTVVMYSGKYDIIIICTALIFDIYI